MREIVRRFLSFADDIGLSGRAAKSVIDSLLSRSQDIDDMVRAAGLPLPEKTIVDLLAEVGNRRRLLG